MNPEMNMEELNKRRVERQYRRQRANVHKKRKQTMSAVLIGILLVAIGVGVFMLARSAEKEEKVPETQPSQTHSEELPEELLVEGSKVIHLVAAGDLNVTDAVVNSGGQENDYKRTFLDVAHLLADADLTVMNFEGNLCGAPDGTATRSAPQELMEELRKCGVDMLQLANSYAINHGVSGLQATIQSVKDAGVEPLGVYGDERAYRAGKGYTIRNVQGIKIAFVAFTKGMDGTTLPQGSENCVNVLYSDYDSTYQDLDKNKINAVLDAVEEENPDLTVAMLHWGSEFNDTISKTQTSLVELLQSRGVDAIIGTHPHYVQKMTYDSATGNFVAYSLGDFISDGERAGTEYSIILDLEITKNVNGTKITGYSYTPIFTVAERGSPLRTVRIRETMAAYESNYIRRVTDKTYESMAYAMKRIEARVKGE